MMNTVKMIYKPTDSSKEITVDVYDIHHTHDANGDLVCSFATGWVTKSKSWITAPLWCFTPVRKKEQLTS